MKYGYFKRGAGILTKGALEYNYNQLSSISGIKVYYDRCGKESPFLYKLLGKLRSDDSLYVLNIYNLGTKPTTIFNILEELKNDKIRFFIKEKEISLDKVFQKVDEMKNFNNENLKNQLYDSDIIKMIIEYLGRY